MNPYREIDLKNWPRTKLFKFFRSFQNSCFNVSFKVHAEPLFELARERGESFFLMSLYAILRAANEVPQMRQRYLKGRVIEYATIAAMTPIMTPDEMYCQAWLEYEAGYAAFRERSLPIIEAAKKGISSPEDGAGEDYICASCVPWMHFESATQACYEPHQAIPILGWGKIKEGEIPFCVQFTHCFVDGLHFSRFAERIEYGFGHPESLYGAQDDRFQKR